MLDSLKTGEFIKEARKKKGLSQNDLAEKLNITRVAVSKWENGHNLPDIVIMKELADILDVDINEIMQGETIEKKPVVPSEEKKKKRWPWYAAAIMALLAIVGSIRIYLPWGESHMSFHMERVYSYHTLEVQGILYYLEYDPQSACFMKKDTRELLLTDENGNSVSVLAVSLSYRRFEGMFLQYNSSGQEIMSYQKNSGDPNDGFRILCFYCGNLKELDRITTVEELKRIITDKAGSYYAYTE